MHLKKIPSQSSPTMYFPLNSISIIKISQFNIIFMKILISLKIYNIEENTGLSASYFMSMNAKWVIYIIRISDVLFAISSSPST